MQESCAVSEKPPHLRYPSLWQCIPVDVRLLRFLSCFGADFSSCVFFPGPSSFPSLQTRMTGRRLLFCFVRNTSSVPSRSASFRWLGPPLFLSILRHLASQWRRAPRAVRWGTAAAVAVAARASLRLQASTEESTPRRGKEETTEGRNTPSPRVSDTPVRGCLRNTQQSNSQLGHKNAGFLRRRRRRGNRTAEADQRDTKTVLFSDT